MSSTNTFNHILHAKNSIIYSKCPKMSPINLSDNMAYANCVDPDPTAPKQSNQGLHCLPLHQVFCRINA